MNYKLDSTKAFLFDLDGTLTVDGEPLPGVGAALKWLKSHGYSVRICTNTTTLSRASMSSVLRKAGFPVEPEEVFSAPVAAAAYLRQHSIRACYQLLSIDVRTDFAEFLHSEDDVQYIVVGDIGDSWDYALMSRLFELVMGGAKIIALHKGRYWLSGGRLKLDIGAFITGLEYAAGSSAILIGKPSPDFFRLALDDLSLPSSQTCMVGDDLINDVQGAQNCGIAGVLVRTGKYRQDSPSQAKVLPDLIIDSVADLPGLLG
jgi:HAD superfamily hydrolase (TIGR01458 family)